MHKDNFAFNSTYLPFEIESLSNAYTIQNNIMKKIRETNNETLGGFKAGLTSLTSCLIITNLKNNTISGIKTLKETL